MGATLIQLALESNGGLAKLIKSRNETIEILNTPPAELLECLAIAMDAWCCALDELPCGFKWERCVRALNLEAAVDSVEEEAMAKAFEETPRASPRPEGAEALNYFYSKLSPEPEATPEITEAVLRQAAADRMAPPKRGPYAEAPAVAATAFGLAGKMVPDIPVPADLKAWADEIPGRYLFLSPSRTWQKAPAWSRIYPPQGNEGPPAVKLRALRRQRLILMSPHPRPHRAGAWFRPLRRYAIHRGKWWMASAGGNVRRVIGRLRFWDLACPS